MVESLGLDGLKDPSSGLLVIKGICLLSASATADSNDKLNRSGASGAIPIVFQTLAVNDQEKLGFLKSYLNDTLHISMSDVAILYESTVFGNDMCRSYMGREKVKRSESCEQGLKVPFPVNIADVRFGLRQRAVARQQRDKNEALKLPVLTDHLSLEEGAENGSEFPESQQSPLTAVSTEFVLENLLTQLARRNPKLVVVVATDVRDRLFLFEKISERLPDVLLVDLGADRLLAHSDFINASRGASVLSSSKLSTCRNLDGQEVLFCGKSDQGVTLDSWATDEQAMLATAIAGWCNVESAPPFVYAKKIHPYAVTRAGLMAGTDDLIPAIRLGNVVLVGAVMAIAFSLYALLNVIGLPDGAILNLAAAPRLSLGNAIWMALVVIAALVVGWTTGLRGPVLIFAFLLIVTPWRAMFNETYWSFTLTWLSMIFLVAILVIALLTLSQSSPVTSHDILSHGSHLKSLLDRLSRSPSSGLAYPYAEILAEIVVVLALWLSLRVASLTTWVNARWAAFNQQVGPACRVNLEHIKAAGGDCR